MGHKIGIWIDHKKAVIVSTSGEGVTSTTVESEIGSHTRFSGGAGHPTREGPNEGGGEKKYEARRDEHLDQYYDEVISRLGHAEALLILGPGEAKLQLEERIGRSKGLAGLIVDVETTDKLTDAQIVEKVKEHYGIR